MNDYVTLIRKMIAPTHRKVTNMIRRGAVVIVNASSKMQSLQITCRKGELLSDVEHMEPYGYTSHPHKGAEDLTVFPAGNGSHGIVITCADRRYRLKGLEAGEIALYTDEGDKIHFKRGRNVELTTNTFTVNAATKIELTAPDVVITASNKITATTPEVAASAKVTAVDDISTQAAVKASTDVYDQFGAPTQSTMSGMRQIFNVHKHVEQGTGDGDDTSVPTQLMEGS